MRDKRQLVLVTGGVRSGKSQWAETLARQNGEPVVYIATSRVLDEEMQERVRRHWARRPATWMTLEAPDDLAGAMRQVPARTRTVLVDCLGGFVSNRLLAETGDGDPTASRVEEKVLQSVQAFVTALEKARTTVIVVTNEVGFGVVPSTPLGRAFRDYLGWSNRLVAAAADQVYLMVAGIPVLVKDGRDSVPQMVNNVGKTLRMR